ncbi:hypothetical protein LTR56_017391 [Elasticomyces elasticus]|nr:hypothetical protein LTR56_017391 [Elasticomyces elasticus]KAK3639075.1 hypothetical protein LTR22_017603 [Elasticomyces elasticus]KAK4915626.1 hypothetical protein LTR49_016228 [Elasticomyces elasticus]KAK5752612.1 hypothetical protein LTS12_017275 [Elasticomyces elasticus]
MASPTGLLHRPNSEEDTIDDTSSPSSTNMSSYADIAAKGPKQAPEDTCVEIPDTLPEIAHDDSGIHTLGGPDMSSSTTSTGSHVSGYSSYADQQKDAEDRAQEAGETARGAAKGTANQASKEVQDFTRAAESSAKQLEQQGSQAADKGSKKAQQVADSASQEWEDVSSKAEKKTDQLASDAQDGIKKGEKKAKEVADDASKYWDDGSEKAKEKYKQLASQAQHGMEKAKIESKKSATQIKQEAKEADEWAGKNKGNPVVIGNLVVVAALGGLLGTNAYRMHKAGTLTWNVIGAWTGAVGLFAVGDYFVSQWFFRNKYPTKK